MGTIVLNDALGRIAEKIDDGADLIIIPLSAVDSDANLKDAYAGGSFLDDVLGAAPNTEQTGSTWARRVQANGTLTVTIDDSGDLVKVIMTDETWTAVLAANDVVALLICEDGASDALRQVLSSHVFAVTTDGNDVTADFSATNGFWQSS